MKKHIITTQVGCRGTGKTEYCKRLIKFNEPERCLVVDVNNEYLELNNVPDEFFTDIKMKGVYRVNFDEIIQKKEIEAKRKSLIRNKKFSEDIFIESLKNITSFSNGLLIIEVPVFLDRSNIKSGFMKMMMSNEFIGLLSTNRTRKVNIILNLSTVKQLSHPKIITNTDVLILRKTSDSVIGSKSKIDYDSMIYKNLVLAERMIRDNHLEFATLILAN